MLQLRHLPRTRPPRVPHLRLSSSASTCAASVPVSSPPLPRPLASEPPPPIDTGSKEVEESRKSFYLYYNLLFPLRTSLFDLRYLLTQFQRPQLLSSLEKQLKALEERYSGRVKVAQIQTREKDGGAFVRLTYPVTEENLDFDDQVRDSVEEEARLALRRSDFKPWFNLLNQPPQTFLVKGRPWMEDMNRFPARELQVEFEGPEIPQERLYELFRPYGKIHDIVPVNPKTASIIFTSVRSATSARNCLHSSLISPSSPNITSPTLLRILYKPKRHFWSYFRDWITGHPKIVLPLFVALLGTISYAVFDPVREFFVTAKVTGAFDADKWRAVKWLKRETLGRLGLTSFDDGKGKGIMSGIEKEREEAKEDLKTWLKGNPESFVTVQGPRGSGKTALVDEVLRDGKNVLTIDCKKICKASRTDAKLVSELATAVGYYPQFVLASSLNNMIDLASMGLIGQKAGFSSSLDTQLKAILEVTTSALAKLSSSIKSKSLASTTTDSPESTANSLKASVIEQLSQPGGTVRDGRLDVVAGNGAISELGGGIEAPLIEINTSDEKEEVEVATIVGVVKPEIVGPQTSSLVRQASKSVRGGSTVARLSNDETAVEKEMERLPVVIIKGFAAKGEAKQEVFFDVLAEWSAVLVENQIAHVIFTSDSPTLSKPLAKALPSKPFNSITLNDASPEASLQYVSTKLSTFSKTLPSGCHASVARLGGRQTDLELLIEKVRAGQAVEEATDDIVSRSATEIRKNFFGDDEDEAKSLKWKREQAGAVMKGLVQSGELKYAETLIKMFGSDEGALRALENSEMISITHQQGRPSLIKPGRPVYRSAFSLLLSDPIFSSTLEYRSVVSALAGAQQDLKASQQELLELSKLFVPETGKWSLGGGSRTPKAVEVRVKKTLEKMRTAEEKVEQLSTEKARLLKVFAENE